jgi:xanthine dioxygenase
VKEILIDPLPESVKREGALYPDGGVVSDLKEVRGLLYTMQRPAISPSVSLLTTLVLFTLNLIHSSSTPITGEHYIVPYWVVVCSLTFDCRRESDLILFHNRGVMHSIVGAFHPDQVRAFHQCNLAASDEPQGPSAEDIWKYA